MKAYKGFKKDMTCLGYQFEEGKTYEEDEAVLCEKGFHACADPLAVFRFYPPADSIYREVELEELANNGNPDGDTKVCGKKITIGGEIGIPWIIKAHIEYVKAHVKESVEKGDSKAATAGYRGAATAGDWGAATAGDWGAATAGDWGAATAGARGAATAKGSAAVGINGIACARATHPKAKGDIGAVLVLVKEPDDDYTIEAWKAIEIDGEKYKANTWYTLDENGEVKEVKGEQK